MKKKKLMKVFWLFVSIMVIFSMVAWTTMMGF